MANVSPKNTGLPLVILVLQKMGGNGDVRIKVARGPKARFSEMLTVAIRPTVRVIGDQIGLTPDELTVLTRWIDLNRGTLIKYWGGDIEYTAEVLGVLKPITASREK
jgi:hypothetical protein